MEIDVEMSFLQDIESRCSDTDVSTAVKATNNIATIIKRIGTENENASLRQTMLNVAFRAYYKLIYKHNLNDAHFDALLNEILTGKQLSDFEMLYSLLLSERGKYIDLNTVHKECLNALGLDDGRRTLLILKNLNFLQRKHPTFDAEITLAQIYVYLQSDEHGMREEVLHFFSHCCRPVERARKYFKFIIENYPWTNRNKYFMLSCILNTHNLLELLEHTSHDSNDFFVGLRLSLNFKYLLPASQHLVKALSKQNSQQLLEISATILVNGTLNHVQNFYAQWFPRITQKDVLFDLIQEKLVLKGPPLTLAKLFKKSDNFLYTFVAYARQIMQKSKVLFYKLSTELLLECFELDVASQMLIYKFFVENMCFFALEDCLEFLFTFIRHHRNIENAQLRNNVLGKLPTIINYITKNYFKVHKRSNGRPTTLDVSVEVFFSNLHQTILDDVENKIYQPKIFALKLLDILLKSLYQQNLEKNAKNCNLAQNQQFGALLISHHIFKATQMTKKLLKALDDPQCYNDALDLIVDLLQRLKCVESQRMIDACQKCCQSVDIDECALSVHYAKVALKAIGNEQTSSVLYKYAMEMLRNETVLFQQDPLLTCKQRNHIFGFLEIINVVLLTLNPSTPSTQETVDLNCSEILDLLVYIENIVLDFLNSSSLCEEEVFVASFHDMDQNLQRLVEKSNFKAEHHEECRKFLLMSFWLTLKACCDVGTTLGCYFAAKYHQQYQLSSPSSEASTIEKDAFIEDLKKCLNLNVFVLTRCRHKGAIEAAGLSIGKLTKQLTSYKNLHAAEIHELIWNCISVLFSNDKSVSTTRRGAGYSIMFLHIIKNDAQAGRPLLKRAMTQIFEILRSLSFSSRAQKSNCDRIESLTLHYLCVSVKDAELRNAISPYYNDIMLAAISNIDDTEWTVCNAALQLFGALVPKVVGQRQATEFEEPSQWEPPQVTYAEILLNMPKTFEYILKYCKKQAKRSTSTRSIILFLEFLSKIEHLSQDIPENEETLFRIRELMWSLLQHPCETVRKLAAICFVRAHDFRYQLPSALLLVSDLLFQIRNENFFLALLFVICEGIAKMINEAYHTVPFQKLDQFYKSLQKNIVLNAKFESKFKRYTQSKFLDMLYVIGLDKDSSLVRELINYVNSNYDDTKFLIGDDQWCQIVKKLSEKAKT